MVLTTPVGFNVRCPGRAGRGDRVGARFINVTRTADGTVYADLRVRTGRGTRAKERFKNTTKSPFANVKAVATRLLKDKGVAVCKVRKNVRTGRKKRESNRFEGVTKAADNSLATDHLKRLVRGKRVEARFIYRTKSSDSKKQRIKNLKMTQLLLLQRPAPWW